VIALIAVSARSQPRSELERHYPVTDPKNFTRVVATVGDAAITAQEFLLSYEFGPAFAKRQKDSRKRYLEFMVNEKLLALDGRARGLGRTESARRALQDLEGDMATEELYKDDVLSRVRVSAGEVARAVRDERVHYSLRWLFAPGPDGGTSLRSALDRGGPFDTLFARQLRDGVKIDDRSMETTLFKLRRSNPALAAVAETLRAGRNSAPVRGPDGWYVLRITGLWRDMSLSETESLKLAEDARSALTQDRSDSLSDLYVRAVMLKHDPVIIRGTFDALEGWLARTWVKPGRFVLWDLASRPGMDSAALSRIDARGPDTLVALTGGCIRLGGFLSWYRARDAYFRLNTANEQSFFISVEELVWRMVRDRLLVDRALGRHLQDRDQVKKQLRWWEDKILFGEEKDALGRLVALDDSTLHAYYDAHTRDYRTDSGAVQTYEGAKEKVRSDCYESGLRANMLHRILALKQKYRVVVKDDVLVTLPVDVENNPKAIDVYIAKKGGTFPHPAFPVIDLGWQTWM
jgi:hypothetical protein